MYVLIQTNCLEMYKGAIICIFYANYGPFGITCITSLGLSRLTKGQTQLFSIYIYIGTNTLSNDSTKDTMWMLITQLIRIIMQISTLTKENSFKPILFTQTNINFAQFIFGASGNMDVNQNKYISRHISTKFA